tara:strand:+ start:1711 stop:2076 length:366 start_codon:yes stop_codon:yes gene_type:complete
MSSKDKIKSKCKELQDLLIHKNSKYGDSALNPLKIFSECNASTSIKVRLDDKLKRIANAGLVEDTEDTLIDIAGYIILLMIAKENESNNIQKYKAPQRSSSHTAGECTLSYSDGEEQGSDT